MPQSFTEAIQGLWHLLTNSGPGTGACENGGFPPESFTVTATPLQLSPAVVSEPSTALLLVFGGHRRARRPTPPCMRRLARITQAYLPARPAPDAATPDSADTEPRATGAKVADRGPTDPSVSVGEYWRSQSRGFNRIRRRPMTGHPVNVDAVEDGN